MQSKPPKRLDMASIRRVLDAWNVRKDPRLLASIAFGIKSPRVALLRMGNQEAFRSLGPMVSR